MHTDRDTTARLGPDIKTAAAVRLQMVGATRIEPVPPSMSTRSSPGVGFVETMEIVDAMKSAKR
jgi:hypothetical protein